GGDAYRYGGTSASNRSGQSNVKSCRDGES
ncbi:hypothetical protein VCHE40_2278B, partial [Vibrio cholerae HE-40]